MRDKAFEMIFVEYNRMITSYLHSIVGNWDDAVDLTQETFLVAYKKMGEFDPTKSIPAWLRGIAKNVGRNRIRKKGREQYFLLKGEAIEDVYASFDNIRSGQKWEERLEALDDCICRLPDSQRESITLFYKLGQSARMIAERMGIVENTVFRRIWEARKNLRTCIDTHVKKQGELFGE